MADAVNRDALQRTTVIKRSDEPIAVEVDGSVVMMSIVRGYYYGLDTVGKRVWELLAEARSIGQICEQLGSEFEVDPATCERDVMDFVRELVGEGLVDVVQAPTA
jgi:hypothetical protein